MTTKNKQVELPVEKFVSQAEGVVGAVVLDSVIDNISITTREGNKETIDLGTQRMNIMIVIMKNDASTLRSGVHAYVNNET